MAETSRARWRQRVESYGIVGPVAVAIAAAVVYYAVHEVFHMLLGFGPTVDTVGSIALGGVAAAVVYALGRNWRAVVAAFVALFATHSLVMGYGGVLAFESVNWSVPVAVVAAAVLFVAAGGLEA